MNFFFQEFCFKKNKAEKIWIFFDLAKYVESKFNSFETVVSDLENPYDVILPNSISFPFRLFNSFETVISDLENPICFDTPKFQLIPYPVI